MSLVVNILELANGETSSFEEVPVREIYYIVQGTISCCVVQPVWIQVYDYLNLPESSRQFAQLLYQILFPFLHSSLLKLSKSSFTKFAALKTDLFQYLIKIYSKHLDTLLELAIPTQNLEKRNFYQSSVQSMPFNTNCMSWNPNERQVSPPVSKDVSFIMEIPPQLHHDAKHLGLQVQLDSGSGTTQSIGQSQGQCVSSESGEDDACGKGFEGTMKPAFLSNLDFMPHPSQAGYSNVVPQFHPYADPYYGAFLTPYGPQAMPAMVGMGPPRVPLPLDLQEDGPIYVNAKQYHGILRRRQSRAKLEAQNKLLKARKPYLHESRHQHALNRVRGSGGRFLSKKELQQYDQNHNSSSNDHVSGSIDFHQKDTPQRENHHSGSSDLVTSVASHSGITSVSGTNAMFRQPDRRFSGGMSSHMSGAMQFSGRLMGGGNQHCASVVR